ncbi:MAG TPA: sigma 54-interacting transcriptional regulator, partial [Longimicrobiaceae bacterium]|nr:sigma 54-interacting transcriptional regulator [Longimicrobiaceae bacterium]
RMPEDVGRPTRLSRTPGVSWSGSDDVERPLPSGYAGPSELVGVSRALVRLRKLALTVAPKTATLLLNGESGTGKEVLAHFIHSHSDRASRPFVAINCAAIPEALIESELFGHEKGAFTGASSSRTGCFVEAHTGVLFLDEVTEIRPHVQAKLLRVLQEREVRRVGGSRSQKVDVRVVAATSRDLQVCLRDGTLRPDLYYRLSVVELHIPPLRERPDDLLPLSEFFLKKHAGPNASRLRTISDDVLEIFHAYGWPGNVRELENVVARATVLAPMEDGAALLPRHLPARVRHGGSEPDRYEAAAPGPDPSPSCPDGLELDFRAAVVNLKRQLAEQALRRANGNKAEAARLMGISRRGFYKFLSPESDTGDS